MALAHPYRDLDVIDVRAPRFVQTTTGAMAIAALWTGVWPILAIAALLLTAGAVLGRKWCLPCRFYFAAIQPWLGEGPIEDARPPRFANQLGAGFLWAATLAHLAGLAALGSGIALLVASLATVSALTGICVGCSFYRVVAQLRGIRSHGFDRIDLAELGAEPGRAAVIQFTHPLCADCHTLARRLAQEGRAPILVDVSRRRDLARKYGVAVVPLAVAVDGDGQVSRRLR